MPNNTYFCDIIFRAMQNRYQELSKTDRKIVRELIDKGIAEEFKRGMENLDSLLAKWRDEAGNHQEHYANLFGEIRDFNKYIARKYDDLRGSGIVDTFENQLASNVVELSELDALSETAREEFLRVVKLRRSYDAE